MLYVKQKIAMVLGLLLIGVHLTMTAFLWFKFADNSSVVVEKMALPISAAFSVFIVKWFIDNRGIIKDKDRIFVGLPYVLMVVMIVFALITAYVGGAFVYLYDKSMDPSQLNSYYLFVESTMGGMMALVFSDLYDKPAERAEKGVPAALSGNITAESSD